MGIPHALVAMDDMRLGLSPSSVAVLTPRESWPAQEYIVILQVFYARYGYPHSNATVSGCRKNGQKQALKETVSGAAVSVPKVVSEFVELGSDEDNKLESVNLSWITAPHTQFQ